MILKLPTRNLAGLFCAVSSICLVLAAAATGQVRIEYDANSALEPDDETLGLGFWAMRYGTSRFPDTNGGSLLTIDDDPEDERGSGAHYYRRQFTKQEFNDKTDLHVEVTMSVDSSYGSLASTCVQFTTRNGRTFGLGFLRKEQAEDNAGMVVLYADSGDALEHFGKHQNVDWMWKPILLGAYRIPVNVKRTYVLELLRNGPGPGDDVIRLSVKGLDRKLLKARLINLQTRAAVPGLLFGHPVNHGLGRAEWHRLVITTTGTATPAGLPRRIGNKRQLFLDDWIIEKAEALQRQLGKPSKYEGNPVISRDKPWDASRCDIYGNALWDPQGKRIQLFASRGV